MGNRMTELRGVTRHMGHNVTCHLTQANTPRLNPSWYSIYLPWKNGRPSWPIQLECSLLRNKCMAVIAQNEPFSIRYRAAAHIREATQTVMWSKIFSPSARPSYSGIRPMPKFFDRCIQNCEIPRVTLNGGVGYRIIANLRLCNESPLVNLVSFWLPPAGQHLQHTHRLHRLPKK